MWAPHPFGTERHFPLPFQIHPVSQLPHERCTRPLPGAYQHYSAVKPAGLLGLKKPLLLLHAVTPNNTKLRTKFVNTVRTLISRSPRYPA